MKVWIVLRDWEEEIEEYCAHHNDEFHGVFATEALALKYIADQPDKSWDNNNFIACEREVEE